MLNGTVEPLLTMTSSTTNRLMSMTKTNGDSNTNNSDTSSKRSTMKIASSGMMSSMNSNNNNPSINSDNRIKFVDMLVCGSCQQDFQLSDIVKFIEHKAICGNKENKRKIPYFLSQRRQREGGDDDDDDDDDDDEEDKSQQSGNSSGNENEHHSNRQQLSQKQSKYSKVLVDASANTLHNSGIHNNDLFEEKKSTTHSPSSSRTIQFRM
jgi:hypothetical protein